MSSFWEVLGSDPDHVPLVIVFGIGGVIAIVSVITCTIAGVCKSKEYERSRREVAAYIAEGSMTPDEGERLLRLGTTEKKS